MNTGTDRRRTDTRQRIHAVALEVFSEVGYERGTLLQIAERLGITRPALYYHYRNKGEILAALHADLAQSVDDIIDWSRSQPSGRANRHETLRRLHDLLRGPWGTFTRFAQASEAAIRDLSATEDYNKRMDAIGALLAPTPDAAGLLRGQLALSALFLAAVGGDSGARADAALEIASELTR
ncbi:TetR/AcrR family transcriptional regulator [Catenuloplanes japonicus]|uniref:TetR/AcrR family transcriptional regulator n=1 Tax=Catenuloplanes japonicus TaxID=33876 RepID=UPI00052466B7|nr:TetR/AcrR family transcriptional regulator [Catenuloplanes japonicus]